MKRSRLAVWFPEIDAQSLWTPSTMSQQMHYEIVFPFGELHVCRNEVSARPTKSGFDNFLAINFKPRETTYAHHNMIGCGNRNIHFPCEFQEVIILCIGQSHIDRIGLSFSD